MARATVLILVALLLSAGTALAATVEILAKSLATHDCESSEWHFVINQLAHPDQAPANITITWNNGQRRDVPVDSVGGGVAHYQTTLFLDATVTEAAARITSPWSGTEWKGSFNLSHGPCGASATRTPTATATPTVVPATSTRTRTPTAQATQTTTPTPLATATSTPGGMTVIHCCSGGGECVPTEWHFIINQLTSESQAPAYITVKWANGQTANVPLEKVTFGSVAHYTTTLNLDSPVISATTTIQTPWSGNFNLSHGPCDFPPPPPPVVTPELGSLGLFGGGALMLAGYSFARSRRQRGAAV